MRLQAGARLGAYEILSPIGSGGMGEVYRARDTELRRDVAVKVLPEATASDAEALDRFRREARAVAAMSHPNVLSIFDFGIQDGIAYAVTEILEGETLHARLAAGPLPFKQAIDYAQQIARGIAAAHERGVVHRDLKPANIFLTRDGQAKILDFGLAKNLAASTEADATSAPTESGLTQPGTVLGTAGYMSPEQVRGIAVDQRSDIFSFGTILCELFSGTPAFRRPTPGDTMAAILKDDPPPISGPGTRVPVALERVVHHCLEKEQENRFQSARDVAFALSEAVSAMEPPLRSSPTARARPNARFAAAAVVLVAVAAATALLLLRRNARPSGQPQGPSRIAVLPFENLGAPEDDYFADGIADEVRGRLTFVPAVQVIARASSTPYKKTTKTPREIGRELQVGYLLTGTVRWEKSGGTSRVQVSPELIEVSSEGAPTSRWQQPFDAKLTDVFQVQSEIASKVAESLGVALGARDEKRLSESPTKNLAAYDLFLKGHEIWKTLAVGDPRGLRQALDFYERAVALDPGFAQAWARIGWGNAGLYANSLSTPALAERARESAEKSVALAPGRPEGYHALGTYRRLVLHDFDGALGEYSRGLRVAPGNVELLAAAAETEESLGRWDAALEHIQEAARLDPRSVQTARRHGDALLRRRRYAEARSAFDRGLALAPGSLYLIEQRAISFLGEGDLAGARAVVAAAGKQIDPVAVIAYVANNYDLVWVLDEPQRDLLLRLTPSAFDGDRAAWAFCLLQASALKGDAANMRPYAAEARRALEEQLRSTPDDPPRRAILGLVLAYAGKAEDGIREGERGEALLPVTKDSIGGAYVQHLLLRTEILAGQRDRAIARIERLLAAPGSLSSGWLRIDPNFDSLRNDPRFQKLAAVAART